MKILTKILTTLGPATADVDTLARFFQLGVRVCRINFSHGELDSHHAMLQNVRSAAKHVGASIAVLGDLCGPKIRVDEVEDQDDTGGMPIKEGQTLVIQRQKVLGGNGRVSSSYEHLVDDAEVGDRILIEDGLLQFQVVEKHVDEIACRTIVGGVIKTRKGINLPDTDVRIPAVTEYDRKCVDWAIEHQLDYLALSFVRRPADLIDLRSYLTERHCDVDLIAKIEKPEALSCIDEIIEACDGLMVARGDLGVEMDLAKVPVIQKELIRECQIAGKPVIVATQMLQSMIDQATPTRAEVSDVANAAFDGADAVMLSGETSVGEYPIEAVTTMAHVLSEAESYMYKRFGASSDPTMQVKSEPHYAAIARGVSQLIHDLDIKLVALWSQSGTTARIFAKHRFTVPILALSSDERALRQMSLHYGVVPQMMDPNDRMSDLLLELDRIVQDRKLANVGDRLVMVSSSSLGTPGMTNSILLHVVGRSWCDLKNQDHSNR